MGLLIDVVVALIIVGLVLWVIEQIPMDAMIARIIRVVVVVCVVLWLLSAVLPLVTSYSGRPLLR